MLSIKSPSPLPLVGSVTIESLLVYSDSTLTCTSPFGVSSPQSHATSRAKFTSITIEITFLKFILTFFFIKEYLLKMLIN